jgi:hypothetical protein
MGSSEIIIIIYSVGAHPFSFIKINKKERWKSRSYPEHFSLMGGCRFANNRFFALKLYWAVCEVSYFLKDATNLLLLTINPYNKQRLDHRSSVAPRTQITQPQKAQMQVYSYTSSSNESWWWQGLPGPMSRKHLLQMQWRNLKGNLYRNCDRSKQLLLTSQRMF